jgi:hypothetical protein
MMWESPTKLAANSLPEPFTLQQFFDRLSANEDPEAAELIMRDFDEDAWRILERRSNWNG